jgi:hypothetical protein
MNRPKNDLAASTAARSASDPAWTEGLLDVGEATGPPAGVDRQEAQTRSNAITDAARARKVTS